MVGKFIDWYQMKKRGRQQYIEKRPENSISWKDLVTGTRFFISKENYDRILKSACDFLKKSYEGQDIAMIQSIFYNPSELEDDIALFSDLPYPIRNAECYVRIRDYVCFRTACFYGIKYKDIREKQNFRQEKEKIRLQGLLWRFVDEIVPDSDLVHIEKLLRGEMQASEVSMEQYAMDIVKGGTIKIKQYYLETNNIPEIRGASRLLDFVNGNKMQQCICEKHIRECLIYTGGGKTLGVFPKGCGAEVCNELEKVIERWTVTAQSNFCSLSYPLEELIFHYKEITEQLDLALEERQNLRWDFRIEAKVADTIFTKTESKFEILDRGQNCICESCRQRYAFAQLKKEPRGKLCQSCLHKNLYGGKAAKESMFQQYRTYIEKRYHRAIENSQNYYNTLGEIGETSNGFIGVIYGDANSMSKKISQLNSFMEMKYFSEVTSEVVVSVVFDGLYKHLKNIPSFEVVAVGGDDIFIIVPGNKAYDIACTIGRSFDKQFKNKTESEYNITMSMGVCISHDKLPVQYSFEIAQQLLKSAKQKAWEERKKGCATGTIDWIAIENDIAGSAVLEYQRKDLSQKVHKTLRPYTWEQADAVKRFISTLKEQDQKTISFQLQQSWYQHTQEESELFYEYQISRDNGNNKRKEWSVSSALEELGRNLNGRVIKNNIELEEEKYSPWIDVIELWDYIEETSDEKGRSENRA